MSTSLFPLIGASLSPYRGAVVDLAQKKGIWNSSGTLPSRSSCGRRFLLGLRPPGAEVYDIFGYHTDDIEDVSFSSCLHPQYSSGT